MDKLRDGLCEIKFKVTIAFAKFILLSKIQADGTNLKSVQKVTATEQYKQTNNANNIFYPVRLW